MVAPLVFVSGFKLVLSQHERLHVEIFKTASRDKETFNLSRNVSRFYALLAVSLTNEQQSQNFFLKVDPLSIMRKNKLFTQGKQLETSAKLGIYRIVAAF